MDDITGLETEGREHVYYKTNVWPQDGKDKVNKIKSMYWCV